MNDALTLRTSVVRRVCLAARVFFVSIFFLWSIAGFFMDGEDQLGQNEPYLVVLGGGVAGERDQLACQLFAQGYGRSGVVLTGGNTEKFLPNRAAFLRHCGIPDVLLKQWLNTANTYEEMVAIRTFLSNKLGGHAIVVSDALHMPRLRFLRHILGLNQQVIFRHSRLGHRRDIEYLFSVIEFWFREPLAYIYYRFRY